MNCYRTNKHCIEAYVCAAHIIPSRQGRCVLPDGRGKGRGRGCEPGSQECQLQPGLWGSIPWVLHWGTAVLSAWPWWAGFLFLFRCTHCLSDISVPCPETEPRPWHRKPGLLSMRPPGDFRGAVLGVTCPCRLWEPSHVSWSPGLSKDNV